jgi:Na+/melibiose symporter-like transporter
MYVSALPLMATFALLFTPPDLGEFGLFLWLMVFSILVRTAMTFFFVPYLALGAELSTEAEERSKIVQFRQAFGLAGYLVVSALAFLVFFSGPQGQREMAAYAPLALTIAVLMGVAVLVSSLGTHRRAIQIPSGRQPVVRRTVSDHFRGIFEAMANRSFKWLLIGVVILYVMLGVEGALQLFLNTFFWELEGAELFMFAGAFPVGAIIGAFVTHRLLRRYEKKWVLIVSTGVFAALQILAILMRIYDLLPPNESPVLVGFLIVTRLVGGFAIMQAFVSVGAMIADVADEHELNSTKRTEGVFFGSYSFAGKCSSGVGSLLAGVGLDLIRWPVGAQTGTVTEIAPETVVYLGILYGPVVAGFGILAVVCYCFYDLDRHKHARIVEQLRKRSMSRQIDVDATSA